MDNLVVETVREVSALRTLGPEWDELARSAGEASPFLSHAWIMNWVDCFGASGSVRVIVARHDGRVIGIAPLCLNSMLGFKVIEFLGFKRVDGELGTFLISPGSEPIVAPAMLQALLDIPDGWDAISFYGVRSGSRLEHILSSHSLSLLENTLYFRSLIGPAYIVRLDGDWDSFMKRTSKRFRSTIRGDRARCAKAGIRFISESALVDHEDVICRLSTVESRSWQGSGGHRVIGDNKRFFLRLLPAWIASGEADILWAMDDDGYRAFLLYLVSGTRGIFYRTGYDKDLGHLSLGANLFYLGLQHLAGKGVQSVDFMTDIGSNRYKERWTKDYEISVRHLFLKKSLRGRLLAMFFCTGIKGH